MRPRTYPNHHGVQYKSITPKLATLGAESALTAGQSQIQNQRDRELRDQIDRLLKIVQGGSSSGLDILFHRSRRPCHQGEKRYTTVDRSRLPCIPNYKGLSGDTIPIVYIVFFEEVRDAYNMSY